MFIASATDNYRMHKGAKERSAALGLSINEYTIGALTQRLRMDAEKMINPKITGSVENSTSRSVENSTLFTGVEETEEGKEENPPTPPFKKKGKKKKKIKTKRTTITRARARRR